MSKYLKNLITAELSRRLEGVDNALLVNVIGIGANETVALRKSLREKDIRLLVVKSSLARRATEGSPLAAAFDGTEGSLAILWGAEDMVSLAKEATRLHKSKEVAAFETRGGIMDGEVLDPAKVEQISKWPTREEQLSIVVGQIMAAGGGLLSAMNAPGALLVSQLEKIAEGTGEAESGEATAET